jgi:hypothetical protein
VCKLLFMHDSQAFQQLQRDDPGIELRQFFRDEPIQGTMLEVLHGNEDMLIVFEPTEEFDKGLRLNELH